MIVFLNGRFVSEARAVVSVFDRGFLFGDGLFETLYVRRNEPFRLGQHLERLENGAQFLDIQPPFSREEMATFARRLIRRNAFRTDSLLRLTLSRGVGVRGYSPRGANAPVLVISQHPTPRRAAGPTPRWRLATATLRLPAGDALARFKTCNKLPQILARAEAEAQGADEALLRNTDGQVVEGAASNLFWLRRGVVFTPPPASGILPGVTRQATFEICAALGIPVREACLRPGSLRRQAAVFLTLSSLGIVAATHLDGHPLAASPVVEAIRAAYWRTVERECEREKRRPRFA